VIFVRHARDGSELCDAVSTPIVMKLSPQRLIVPVCSFSLKWNFI